VISLLNKMRILSSIHHTFGN